jgi:hypothetical protein
MESGLSTFFSIGIIALFVAALVTFVGYYWFRSCDGFTSTDAMMKKILEKKDEGFQNTGSGSNMAVPAPKRKTANRMGSGPMRRGSGPRYKVSKKMPPGQMGSEQMGSGQMGSGQMGSGQMGSGQMGSADMRPTDMGSMVPAQMGSGPMGSGPMGSGPMEGFTDPMNDKNLIAHSKGKKEGFAGPSVGAGEPNCMHVSSDAAALYDMLSKRNSTTEEGPDDLRELKQILSKISCFKKDLLAVAGVVEATRYQKFATAHDLEPVAETTARCFAKTIPQRDLSLSLDKWGSRGTFLLKRLCTSQNLSDSEENEALRYFGDAMADITEIALGKCCNSDVGIIAGQPQPRMVAGFEPVENEILRPYDGYY